MGVKLRPRVAGILLQPHRNRHLAIGQLAVLQPFGVPERIAHAQVAGLAFHLRQIDDIRDHALKEGAGRGVVGDRIGGIALEGNAFLRPADGLAHTGVSVGGEAQRLLAPRGLRSVLKGDIGIEGAFPVEALIQHRVAIGLAQVFLAFGRALPVVLPGCPRGQDHRAGRHHIGGRLAVLRVARHFAARLDRIHHHDIGVVCQRGGKRGGGIVVGSGVAGAEHTCHAPFAQLGDGEVDGAARALPQPPRVVGHAHVHALVAGDFRIVEARKQARQRIGVAQRHDLDVGRHSGNALAIPTCGDDARHMRAVVVDEIGGGGGAGRGGQAVLVAAKREERVDGIAVIPHHRCQVGVGGVHARVDDGNHDVLEVSHSRSLGVIPIVVTHIDRFIGRDAVHRAVVAEAPLQQGEVFDRSARVILAECRIGIGAAAGIRAAAGLGIDAGRSIVGAAIAVPGGAVGISAACVRVGGAALGTPIARSVRVGRIRRRACSVRRHLGCRAIVALVFAFHQVVRLREHHARIVFQRGDEFFDGLRVIVHQNQTARFRDIGGCIGARSRQSGNGSRLVRVRPIRIDAQRFFGGARIDRHQVLGARQDVAAQREGHDAVCCAVNHVGNGLVLHIGAGFKLKRRRVLRRFFGPCRRGHQAARQRGSRQDGNEFAQHSRPPNRTGNPAQGDWRRAHTGPFYPPHTERRPPHTGRTRKSILKRHRFLRARRLRQSAQRVIRRAPSICENG